MSEALKPGPEGAYLIVRVKGATTVDTCVEVALRRYAKEVIFFFDLYDPGQYQYYWKDTIFYLFIEFHILLQLLHRDALPLEHVVFHLCLRSAQRDHTHPGSS